MKALHERYRIAAADGVDAAAELFASLGDKATRLAPVQKQLRVELRRAPLDRVSLASFSLAGRFELDRGPLIDFAFAHTGVFSWSAGRRGCVQNAFEPFSCQTSGGTTISLLASRDVVCSHLSSLIGESVDQLRFEPTIELSNPAVAAFRSAIDHAAKHADAASMLVANPIVAERLCDLLLTSALYATDHDYSRALRVEQPLTTPSVVSRAAAYIDANSDRVVTIAELVRETGVSAKSLNRSFKERFSKTVYQYALDRRYARVRDALLRSGGRATVAQIARSHAFVNLGVFAREYAKRFGERPSATLSRFRR